MSEQEVRDSLLRHLDTTKNLVSDCCRAPFKPFGKYLRCSQCGDYCNVACDNKDCQTCAPPIHRSPEQQARDLLERSGIEDAQSKTAGDVVELANLIAERDELRGVLQDIQDFIDVFRERRR